MVRLVGRGLTNSPVKRTRTTSPAEVLLPQCLENKFEQNSLKVATSRFSSCPLASRCVEQIVAGRRATATLAKAFKSAKR